MYSMT